MVIVLSSESCDIFPYVINARIYLVDHLIMPETNNMPAQCFHQNIPMYVICLTASISVKMPSLPINLNINFKIWNSQIKISASDRILRLRQDPGSL